MTRRRVAGFAAAVGLLLLAFLGAAAPAGAGDSAVVLVYQRVGETERHRLESVTVAQFDAHLAYLKRADFRVMQLRDVVAALAEGRDLPERTVAITFDNAFKSVYREAWPRLRAAGFPFSVFVATDAVDAANRDVMSWSALRALAVEGVAIESRGASNRPLWRLDSSAQRDDLARGRDRIASEIGAAPRLFAYPSGEWSGGLAAQVRGLGFDAAFALRSGPLHAAENFFALPRFELNEPFGDLNRFKTIVAVRPLPIRDLAPSDAILASPRPQIRFAVDDTVEPLDALACHVSPHERASVAIEARVVTIDLGRNFEPGHDNRVNCTLVDAKGRTRWLGLQYVVP